MKKLLQATLAALGLLATPLAQAWTYSNGDVLLIFRDGTYDVEFDIGNVSQFTGKTNGYTTTITNWSFNLVTGTFGPDVTTNGDGVTVLLAASTSSTDPNPTAWLSGLEPNTTAYSPSPSGWGNLYGSINSVGISPNIYDVPTNSVPQSYVIRASGSGNAGRYKYASYDYVVSGGTYNGIPQFGGGAPFIVEQTIPGFLDLWAIQSTSSTPLPPDNLVGTFWISTNGVLTFVAGPRPSNIVGITSVGGVNTVRFTTTVSGTYQLVYTNAPSAPRSGWAVAAGGVAGDGKIHSLSHTNACSAGFYGVEITP
jgi:hypothetical protein